MSIKVSHSSACLNSSYWKFQQRPDFLPIQETQEYSSSSSLISEERTIQPAINISILGKSSVGKTALVVRYLTGKFIGEYESDTDTIYKFDFKLAGSTFPVAIKDYRICEEVSQSQIDDLVEQEDAFVLVYDVCDRRSFDHVRALSYRIRSSKEFTTNKRILIVGNKKDLTHLRNVSKKEGELLAKSAKLGIFAETSALEWQGFVPDAFHKLLFVIGSTHLIHEPCKITKVAEKRKTTRRSQSFKHLSWESSSSISDSNGMFFVGPQQTHNLNNNNKDFGKPSIQERRKNKKCTPNLLTVPSFDYCSSGGSQNTSPALHWSNKSTDKEDTKSIPKFCYSAPYYVDKKRKTSMFEFPDVGDRKSLPKTPCSCDKISPEHDSPKGFFNQIKGSLRRKKLNKSPKQNNSSIDISDCASARRSMFQRSYSTILLPNEPSLRRNSSFNDSFDCCRNASLNRKKFSPLSEKDPFSKASFGSKFVRHKEKLKNMLPSSMVTSQ